MPETVHKRFIHGKYDTFGEEIDACPSRIETQTFALNRLV
jgi:hypothetical protein